LAERLEREERLWPLRVSLVRELPADPGTRVLAAGTRGVLIRVEPGGLVRIDFGRAGVRRVPIAATDLVARASEIESGAVAKELPNFSFAIRQKLIDSDSDPMQPLAALDPLFAAANYLCVFADPDAESLPALARALAPLGGRADLAVIFFPQHRATDLAVRDRLRELDWRVAYLYAHLSEPYTRSLLDADTPLPALLLQSAEGRVLLERSGAELDPERIRPELERALEPVASR
jgi:hypothetical protein